MALAVHTFTIAGRELLSAASATKTIDIDHIYCIESEVSQADILSQPKSYFAALASNKLSASVTSAGEDPNNPGRSRIVIEVELTAQASADVTLKTLVVCAHAVDAGVDGEEKTFYGISDPTGIVIPYSTSIPIKQNLSFSFAFTDESEITVDGDLTSYLLESEVGRFVTTHKAGEPTEGEAQDIRGYKRFHNGIGLTGIWSIDDENHSILIAGTIYPEDDTTNIGTPESQFGIVYCDEVKTDALSEFQPGGISLGSDLIPSNVGVNLGTSARPFANMNAHTGAFQTAFCGTLDAIVGGSITLNAGLNPVDEFIDLGSSSNHFGAIYVDAVNGVIPQPESDISIPVGAITMLLLAKSDGTTFTTLTEAKTGITISSSGGTLGSESYGKIYPGEFRQTGSGSDLTIISASVNALEGGMTFKVLIGGSNNGGLSTIPVLAIRIE